MSAASMVARGRIVAEELMVDVGTITRAGADTFNPTTGLIEPGTPTTIYDGPLRVRAATPQETDILFGEEQRAVSRLLATVPHDTTGVKVDDIVTVTTTDDDDMLTRRFRVTSIPMMTFVLYKGFPVEFVE